MRGSGAGGHADCASPPGVTRRSVGSSSRQEVWSLNAFVPKDFGIGRLFKHVRDAVIVGNARTERIVLWNESASSVFGYSEDEALAMPLHELVPPAFRESHRNGLARYQATGEGNVIRAGRPVEVVGLRKDGSEIPIELTLTAVPEVGPGGDRFALAIVRDTSDRKAAEQARLELERARTRRQEALELNDSVVQGLVTAKAALELGRFEQAADAITVTLGRAKSIVSDLLKGIGEGGGLDPGDLLRETSATIAAPLDEAPGGNHPPGSP